MTKKECGLTMFTGREAVIATMHKKETVIAPILKETLGIELIVPEGFNSDQFGTFTGETKRTGNQMEAARLKAEGAMNQFGQTLSISSEGSFGPHPMIPFLPYNREIVLLIDKENDIEISGVAATTETAFKHKVVRNHSEAHAFALSAGFPETGMVVKVSEGTKDPEDIFKGITTHRHLEESVHEALLKSTDQTIFIETDVRALFNPKRMKTIETATKDLVKNVLSLCPQCSWPGYSVTDSKKGLPCGWCKRPTELTLSLHYECSKCNYNEERLYPLGKEQADPGHCSYCNP
ncbi:DUF6671 family protein [Alkalibacterium olivapovliticus]|uniref:DUF6671 domain-containing protein n=1 Tax=Alkalibacterium olivapovliticus TaxID=99907 RepID=A0A2T0W872_9LACT|nr:DUF6671 family protein [Alkalibacterium olivapovliticus]PRY82866.1 hypothetical protein CLV38_10876 [Alkalibacterium olivapovliticus]